MITIRNGVLLLSINLMLCLGIMAQVEISGTVTDGSNEEAIIGASILIENTSTGTVSDWDGSFTFETDNTEPFNLVVSYTGYETQTVNVNPSSGTGLAIALKESTTSLDEVVVTGSFSSRSQKESPISMTYMDSKSLQRVSSSSQADILMSVPGITAEGGGGEVASNVFVRGMPSGGQYQFTPLQVDGLPVISTFGLNSSAHDVYFRNDIGIRNLEFTRGGASTMFGAGSVAGIINYSSVTGTQTNKNKVQLEWADGGRAKIDFLTSGPLSETVTYAFSGFYRYDEGPLETGLATKGAQLRGNLKKMFNEGKSSVTVYGQFIDDNVQFYLPYPLQNENGEFSRPTGNDGEEIYTLLTSQATDFSFDTPNGRYNSSITNGVATKGGYVMAALKHSFENNWRLSAKVKYASYDHHFDLFLDGDGTHNVPETQASFLADRNLPADARLSYVDTGDGLAANDLLFQNRILDRNRPMNEIIGEFNLTKTVETGNAEHNFTVGSFLSSTRADDDNWIYSYVGDFSNSPRMVAIEYDNTAGDTVQYTLGGYVDGSGRQTSDRYHISNKYAFYLSDEIKMNRFTLDIGLRYETARGIINRATGVGSNTFQKGTVSASDVAVSIAGLYKLSAQTNIYANFSRGYFFPELRGVGFLSPGVAASYETEKVIQGEVGAKIKANKLSATIAAFLVALNDRRSVELVDGPNGSIIEEVSVQSTRTVGTEINANYAISKDFQLNGTLTYQNHEFTKVESNPEQEGNWLRRQPQIMGTLAATYDNNIFDASVSSTFLGKRFANDANSVELDPYSLVRFDAGYKIKLGTKKESLRLGVSIFNVFDSEGITEGSPRQGSSQIGGGDFFVGRPILPRRLFLRAQFEF